MKGKVHKNLGSVDEKGNFRLRKVSDEELKKAIKENKKRTKNLKLKAFHEMGAGEIQALQAQHIEEHLARQHSKSPHIKTRKREYAKCLRDQGRIEEALSIIPDDKKFLKGAEAIDRSDDDWCTCENDIIQFEGNAKYKKPLYSKRTVFNEKYGGNVPLWKCKKCGHLNVTHEVPPQDKVYWENWSNVTKGMPAIELLEKVK